MYVLREFEDAIDDCDVGSIDNNYGSAHAWDEGVAFYTGSLEGQDGSGSGQMLHALADKRCAAPPHPPPPACPSLLVSCLAQLQELRHVWRDWH